MRSSAHFTATVSRGRRLPSGPVVLHLLPPSTSPAASTAPTTVGLVVSRAVGGAVVRHRVSRRLRHVIAAHVDDLPPGTALVVRALPSAANSTSVELDRAVEKALQRASRPRTEASG